MPEIKVEDLRQLAFPKGLRQQYQVIVWQDQRKYFLLIMIVGCVLFLLGAML